MTEGMAFSLRGVEVRFGAHRALRGIDLDVAPGEQLALVGPSGSGKTTLLRVLQTALRPAQGAVKIDDRLLADVGTRELRPLRAAIGSVPQDLRLVPNLRVHQNVATARLGRHGFWGGLRRVFAPTRPELRAIHALLDELGIEEKLYERTDRLSGGQQQRVALARALHQEPRLMLADEPVSAVDPARAEELVRILCDRARRAGIGLIVSIHNLELARAHFPRLVGLRAGTIVFDRPSAELGDADFESLYALDAGADPDRDA